MAATEVILIGGGGHARVVADCLLAQGIRIKGFFDNRNNGYVLDLPFIGNYNHTLHSEIPIIIAIGDNDARKRLAEMEIRHSFATAIDASAICSTFSKVDEGSMILHGVIIQAGTKIGKHVILNTGCQVDHDCIIGNYAHVAPGSVLCGGVEVGEQTLIGARSVVIPKVKIGSSVTIGAGTVVTKDIPDFAVAVGNPARIIKYNKP
jgi:sugar O-acyltransferase (sialic acid O-acetyltransferase NeuD family)